MSEQPAIRLEITPEPTDDEVAAIAASLAAMQASVDPDEIAPPPDAWREAGRREAMRESEWVTTTW